MLLPDEIDGLKSEVPRPHQYAIIKLAMQLGNQGQVVGSAVFALPKQLGLIGQWIADYRKAIFQQRGETLVLRSFRFGLLGING